MSTLYISAKDIGIKDLESMFLSIYATHLGLGLNVYVGMTYPLQIYIKK